MLFRGIALTSYKLISNENSDQSFGQLVKKQINRRCPVIIFSDVFTADDAIDALVHGDIVAIGRAALQDT